MGFENGHLARATFRATKGTNEVVNTLHYDLAATGGLPLLEHLQSLADRLRDDCLTAYKNLFDGSWTIQPVSVVDEIDPLHVTAVRNGVVSGAAAGGSHMAAPADEQLPLEMCGVATLYTGHIGRRFRGRMFLPPVWSDARTDNGQLGDGAVALYQAFLDSIPHEPDIVTGPSTDTAKWCVYSRTQRAANLDPYASAVQSVVLRRTIHWLRSRGR